MYLKSNTGAHHDESETSIARRKLWIEICCIAMFESIRIDHLPKPWRRSFKKGVFTAVDASDRQLGAELPTSKRVKG